MLAGRGPLVLGPQGAGAEGASAVTDPVLPRRAATHAFDAAWPRADLNAVLFEQFARVPLGEGQRLDRGIVEGKLPMECPSARSSDHHGGADTPGRCAHAGAPPSALSASTFHMRSQRSAERWPVRLAAGRHAWRTDPGRTRDTAGQGPVEPRVRVSSSKAAGTVRSPP